MLSHRFEDTQVTIEPYQGPGSRGAVYGPPATVLMTVSASSQSTSASNTASTDATIIARCAGPRALLANGRGHLDLTRLSEQSRIVIDGRQRQVRLIHVTRLRGRVVGIRIEAV